jgi:hypothetical protein
MLAVTDQYRLRNISYMDLRPDGPLPLSATRNGCYAAATSYELQTLGIHVAPAEIDRAIGREPGQAASSGHTFAAARWLIEQHELRVTDTFMALQTGEPTLEEYVGLPFDECLVALGTYQGANVAHKAQLLGETPFRDKVTSLIAEKEQMAPYREAGMYQEHTVNDMGPEMFRYLSQQGPVLAGVHTGRLVGHTVALEAIEPLLPYDQAQRARVLLG